jgi:hypothetical protein
MYAALHSSLRQSAQEISPTVLAICSSKDNAISRIRQSLLKSLDFWKGYWFMDKTKWNEQNPHWNKSIDEIAANPTRDTCIRGSVDGEEVEFHYCGGNEFSHILVYVPEHTDHIEAWGIQPVTLDD